MRTNINETAAATGEVRISRKLPASDRGVKMESRATAKQPARSKERIPAASPALTNGLAVPRMVSFAAEPRRQHKRGGEALHLVVTLPNARPQVPVALVDIASIVS